MAELTLFAESEWVSPWVFHAMVALEEKRLPYRLEVLSLPMPADKKQKLIDRAIVPKVPVLVHDDVWITESLAISEYVAERFPTPQYPRIFPADLAERARARQVMSWLRTSLFALREERPTSTIFGRPTRNPLSGNAKADAVELVRIAERLVAPGKLSMFGDWCIADADLTLALMRLVHNEDPVPSHIADYVITGWQRPSIRKFLSHITTTPD
jgi:glutathione S-transferase